MAHRPFPRLIPLHAMAWGGGIEWSILEHIDSVLTLFTTDDQFIERSSLNTVLRPAIDELFTSERTLSTVFANDTRITITRLITYLFSCTANGI